MICWNDAGAEDGLQQLPAAQDRPAAAGADPQRLGVHPVRALQLGQALPQAGAAGGAYLIQSHELLEFLDFTPILSENRKPVLKKLSFLKRIYIIVALRKYQCQE